MKRKPDALLLLALFFGLGLIVSTLTHGEDDADRAGPVAVSSAADSQMAHSRVSQ